MEGMCLYVVSTKPTRVNSHASEIYMGFNSTVCKKIYTAKKGIDNMNYYIIKNKRLRDYLYNLGFDYKQQEDKTLRQDFVYVFSNTDLLQEAIRFYTEFKKKMYSK